MSDDIVQIWADEMNGKVPKGTYAKALLDIYPSSPAPQPARVSDSATQPEIKFCESCGTALGMKDDFTESLSAPDPRPGCPASVYLRKEKT